MQITDKRTLKRWIIVLFSFIMLSFILWNTYSFFQILKIEERQKMELWANAQKTILNANENTDMELPFYILSNNKQIPLILTNSKKKILSTANIDESIEKDSTLLKAYITNLELENRPIKLQYSKNEYQLLYYGNSVLLNKLIYYPIILVLILFLFSAVVYNFYKASRMATENKLWAGMAKETAHQIGTPLSSLIGWLELLKVEESNSDAVIEIEKDINRLQTITDRFSKIGSEPIVEKKDIIFETLESINYLQARSSKQIHFEINIPKTTIYSNINPILHSWSIENLVKNAIDAMKGKGTLKLAITIGSNLVFITITDSGCGISKNNFKKIFEPGFTSKKRGWGLGLSLTKRIVEDYHKGKIRVVSSEIGKGTTFQIVLPVLH